MNRKQRRETERRRAKGDPKQLMSDQIGLFGKLPSACDACQKAFDKKDRDMVFSWRVVVKQETVRLFCPNCIDKTKKILTEEEKKWPSNE